MMYDASKDKSELLTIGHGDLWSNNMMFKFDPETGSEPKAVKFIDFQMMSLAHPTRYG